jgi:LmbE family N-acetylglucosaminyl deacetylase
VTGKTTPGDHSDASARLRMPVGDLPELESEPTVDLPVPGIALAVGAHPDDIEFGCGATLAKWAARGCRVHHLVLTDGSKGTWDPAIDIAELRKIRKEEQLEAARLVGGGEVTFLDIVDGELESDIETRKSVCGVIRRVRPDVLLGHDPWRRYRLHPDHRHAGWLVTDGLVAARDQTFFPEAGKAHRPAHLLLWEADVPNHVEDADGHVPDKLAALMAHRSQHVSTMGIGVRNESGVGAKTEEDEFFDRVRAQLAAHGAIGGLVLGEAFHRIDAT